MGFSSDQGRRGVANPVGTLACLTKPKQLFYRPMEMWIYRLRYLTSLMTQLPFDLVSSNTARSSRCGTAVLPFLGV